VVEAGHATEPEEVELGLRGELGSEQGFEERRVVKLNGVDSLLRGVACVVRVRGVQDGAKEGSGAVSKAGAVPLAPGGGVSGCVGRVGQEHALGSGEAEVGGGAVGGDGAEGSGERRDGASDGQVVVEGDCCGEGRSGCHLLVEALDREGKEEGAKRVALANALERAQACNEVASGA
jgi:hypothetical protein